jgi:bifunctional non-homologous end joining protein LigD
VVREFKNAALNIVPLITGTKEKRAFFNRMKAEKREGVVFKRLDAVYKPGKGHHDMFKCKFWAELSARVASRSTGKESVGVELLDSNGRWVDMGNVTTIGKGRILPGMIIEVKYLYCLEGGSLYQPSVKMIRDDVDEAECVMTQVKYKPKEE